jgi:hypothetical protein
MTAWRMRARRWRSTMSTCACRWGREAAGGAGRQQEGPGGSRRGGGACVCVLAQRRCARAHQTAVLWGCRPAACPLEPPCVPRGVGWLQAEGTFEDKLTEIYRWGKQHGELRAGVWGRTRERGCVLCRGERGGGGGQAVPSVACPSPPLAVQCRLGSTSCADSPCPPLFPPCRLGPGDPRCAGRAAASERGGCVGAAGGGSQQCGQPPARRAWPAVTPSVGACVRPSSALSGTLSRQMLS